jgi:hypothetical protein
MRQRDGPGCPDLRRRLRARCGGETRRDLADLAGRCTRSRFAGRYTSISVEDGLRYESLSHLVNGINTERQHANLSSAIILFVLGTRVNAQQASKRTMRIVGQRAVDGARIGWAYRRDQSLCWTPSTITTSGGRSRAIRNGDMDGNPTDREATWQPIANTPIHPEYPCAHCIQSGIVAGVVKAVLGQPEPAPRIASTPR